MSNLVVAPVVMPLLTGAVLLFAPRRLAWQRGVSIVSALLVVAVGLILVRTAWQGGIQVFQAGNWPAPFGITLVADLTSALLVSATSVAALAVVLFSPYGMGKDREELYYYAGFHFLLVGVHGSFLTGDIFNLFVFFELMLLASYLLVALGGTAVQLRETFKYALINNVASGFFLLGVAWLYRTYGTLNMADLALRVSMSESNGWLSVIAVLFIVVFGVKAAVFPLYGWLPGSYFAGPTPVVAFFGGVLSKVGIYALLRTFTLIFVEDPAFTHRGVLLPLALITMVIGIIGAIAQTDFKRILSFHIISQIGYMLMGIGLLTPLAIAGTIIFVVHQMVVKTVLFLTAGAAEQVTGTTDLRKMSGLLTSHGPLGVLFLIAALALVGIPPLSGFFGKLTLLQAGVEARAFFSVAVALIVGLGTLFSMIKIFRYSFWGEEKGLRLLDKNSPAFRGLLAPIALLVVVSAALGLGAEHVITYTSASAQQLLSGQAYIEAVLGSFVVARSGS